MVTLPYSGRVGFINRHALLAFLHNFFAGIARFLQRLRQRQFGDLLSHKRVKRVLALEIAEVAVRFLKGKWIGHHPRAAQQIGQCLGRDAPKPRGGIHRASFFSRRKQQLMRHEIAVAFLVAFILNRAPGLSQHSTDPILHRARFGLGGKFLGAVRRHFTKRHRLQHARPQLGLFAIARCGLELIDTNLSLLLVRPVT